MCIDHMWAYNGQTESGTGCWEDAVCSAPAFLMFDERKIQWFCSEDQKTAAAGLDAPFGLTAVNTPHWD
jgi:hypothetical protein